MMHLGVKFGTQLANYDSIHGNSAVDNEFISSPSASNSGIGDDFIEAGKTHKRKFLFLRLSIDRQSTSEPKN
jgi:hypothetical protein